MTSIKLLDKTMELSQICQICIQEYISMIHDHVKSQGI